MATSGLKPSAKLLCAENVKSLLNSVDTVLTDCDGVLWNGSSPIPGTAKVLQRLQALGKDIFYVTNNSTKTRKEYVEKCTTMGFPATEENIIGSAYVTAQYIKRDLGYQGKVYVIGSTGLSGELDAAGISNMGAGVDNLHPDDVKKLASMPLDPDVKCVVVGYDNQFNYLKMAKAVSYLHRGDCHFIATNMDSGLPTGQGTVLPGTGSIVVAVETAAQRKADRIMGKPHQSMFEVLKEKHSSVDPARTLMIGDRLDTDILLAVNCGLQSLLVLTGFSKLAEVESMKTSEDPQQRSRVPNYYVPSLAQLNQFMDECEL